MLCLLPLCNLCRQQSGKRHNIYAISFRLLHLSSSDLDTSNFAFVLTARARSTAGPWLALSFSFLLSKINNLWQKDQRLWRSSVSTCPKEFWQHSSLQGLCWWPILAIIRHKSAGDQARVNKLVWQKMHVGSSCASEVLETKKKYQHFAHCWALTVQWKHASLQTILQCTLPTRAPALEAADTHMNSQLHNL